MKTLEPPDLHYLKAAEGWLELGNQHEAKAELEKIRPQLRDHPGVLQVRWHICAMAQEWEACADLAKALTQCVPDQDQCWINLGNSLYFAGRTREAYDCVIAVLEHFPANPVLRYNLACYACQLGHLEEAAMWLDKAFALDPTRKLEMLAREDPDLEPLRGSTDKK